MDKIKAEYKELLEKINDLLDILAKEARVLTIIKDELQVIKEKHGTPRLTRSCPTKAKSPSKTSSPTKASSSPSPTTASSNAPNVSSYRAQRRGGKGVIGMTTREGAHRRGQGFRRASLHRHHARLPDVLHEYRPLFMSSACMKFPTWAAPPRAAASPTCWN